MQILEKTNDCKFNSFDLFRCKKRLAMVLICSFLSGCSTFSDAPELPGTGSDKLPQSRCVECRGKPVFYKNGQWVKP